MAEKFSIVVPTPEDTKKAALLEAESFPHPWREEDFVSQTKNDNFLFLVAKAQEAVIGYISISIVLNEASINTIAIDKNYRRKGAARSLIKHALTALDSRCDFLTLEVRESNLAAISLYSSLGFEEVGKRPRFYRDPDETAILMTKYLKENVL